MPGIDTESQYTVYTVTKKIYIQARRQREVTVVKPPEKEPYLYDLMGLRLANWQAAILHQHDRSRLYRPYCGFVCKTDSLIVIVYQLSSG